MGLINKTRLPALTRASAATAGRGKQIRRAARTASHHRFGQRLIDLYGASPGR